MCRQNTKESNLTNSGTAIPQLWKTLTSMWCNNITFKILIGYKNIDKVFVNS